jgi:Ca-activated chloride channel homolog
LPIVLFLTDGLPTVGQTSEVAIRDVAIHANPYQRRVFTFGVGLDVNTPLLERIAAETRATPTFVLPNEDVEVKVAGVFKRLIGPVLADPKLEIAGSEDKPGPRRVQDLLPGRLPDMFEGDQLVLLGQYKGEEPLTFRLSGNYLGKQRVFTFNFGLEKATTRNAFVPRLWASRKIAFLVDAIRQLGAEGSPATVSKTAATNPQVKELVDEIVRLSKEYGILTEYTAFLARDGTDLSNRDNVLAVASANFERRAMQTRSGLGAVNQSFNGDFMNNQMVANGRNSFYDERMNRVSVTNVQQVNDRAFYNRNGRWVDSQVVDREREIKPTKVIEFGSDEFGRLAERLAAEGRQGSISLRGEILLMVGNEPVLVK